MATLPITAKNTVTPEVILGGQVLPFAPIIDNDLWSPQHLVYRTRAGHGLAMSRVEGLSDAVESLGFEVDDEKVEQAKEYVDRAYGQFWSDELRGGHAFMVPSRLSKDNIDALPEAYTTIMPFLDCIEGYQRDSAVVRKLGIRIMRLLEAMPPFVIDKYDSIPGGIVFAPITAQILEDYSDKRDSILLAREIANDAAEFAQKNGATILGLGATIPSLTNYGRSIKQKVATPITTGHAGTAWLVQEQVRESIRQSSDARLAILGNGAIGSVLAEYLCQENPESQIVLFDKNLRASQNTKDKIGSRNVKVASSAKELIDNSDVIVSAVTEHVDLESLGVLDLTGKIIIDDSQPAAFRREQVISRGGELRWVVGLAKFLQNTLGWSYAGTIVSGRSNPSTAVFGCEAEAAVIAQAVKDGASAEQLVIGSRSIDTTDVRRIGELFRKYWVEVAPSQSYGIINPDS